MVRTLILLVATMVVALLSGALLLPRGEARAVATTEEVRCAHDHHHHAISSFTEDTDDDGDGDDDVDDATAAAIAIAAPVSTKAAPLVVDAFVPGDFQTLGPSSAHHRLLERPPRT